MDLHHFLLRNSLFPWLFSIAMLASTRWYRDSRGLYRKWRWTPHNYIFLLSLACEPKYPMITMIDTQQITMVGSTVNICICSIAIIYSLSPLKWFQMIPAVSICSSIATQESIIFKQVSIIIIDQAFTHDTSLQYTIIDMFYSSNLYYLNYDGRLMADTNQSWWLNDMICVLSSFIIYHNYWSQSLTKTIIG